MTNCSMSIDGEPGAFAFVCMLASELSDCRIDLPSFPDVTRRVRHALQEEDVSADSMRRVL